MKIVRKLYLSVLSLILVAITFTATTFAWFQINSSASVEGFDFELQSGYGFVVSSDGINYKNAITSKEIKQLIILNQNSEDFELVNNELTNKESSTVLTEADMNKYLSEEVLFLPLTSQNGIDLIDLYNSTPKLESGRYIEFSIYFKAASNVKDDNLTYDIFLNGEEITNSNTGQKVAPTSISSEPTEVELKANMTAYSNGVLSNYVKGDKITVYSSNAMRMSIQDTSIETPQATIYELSDQQDLEFGSYTTDYDGADEALDKLYNADHSAMFTYYNNLRPNSRLNKLEFEAMPQSIRTLGTEDQPKVTTVTSGEDAKLITFRFWLEGWDSDCFDGLAKAISVKLSFTSKRVI